jgi:hypothetical protein
MASRKSLDVFLAIAGFGPLARTEPGRSMLEIQSENRPVFVQ